MRDIIDNLTRQHKELIKVTMKLVQQLDGVGRGYTSDAYQSLRAMNGILRVHIAMEDRSFYPSLLDHRDQVLREMAQRFLKERGNIQERYEAYIERWQSISAIDAAPQTFVSETREMLMTLGSRMVSEDRELHPAIRKHFD
jgi:hemerythrin-like domain-containing protein